MKFIVVCACLVILAVSSMAVPTGDGRPGCRTETEITNKVYRNFWDPTAYWVCSELNTAASAARCPDEEAFQASLNKCVSWDDWNWESLVAPLSVPLPEAPATAAPATEAPATEAPATEAPATEAPATEAPATEAPATEAPATEAPATEAPATEAAPSALEA